MNYNSANHSPLAPYAQNPLHTFPHNFPEDGKVADLLETSCCNGIWEMTTDTTDFCSIQLVTEWSYCGLVVCCGLVTLPTCYGFATGKLV